MRHFYTSDPPTGAGKTYAATNYAAIRSERNGQNTAIVMPTIELMETEAAELKNRLTGKPEISERIKVIRSEPDQTDKVITRLVNHLRAVKADDGQILFHSHEALLRLPYWHRPDHWHLIVDETIETIYTDCFRLHENRNILLQHITIEPYEPVGVQNTAYSILIAKDQNAIEKWGANLKGDELTARFTELASKLKKGSYWTIFVETEKFNRFVEGADDAEGYCQLEIHGRLNSRIFDNYASVTIMGANLKKSLMYKNFLQQKCTFSEHPYIMKNLRYKEHTNGKRLKIFYFTKKNWSKYLRDKKVGEFTLKEIFLAEIKEKFKGEPFLWIGNNDISDSALPGTRLSNRPHGLNQFQGYNQCAIVSALNATTAHDKFLLDMFGITREQRRTAMLGQLAYQALGRGAMRNILAEEDFIMIVPDYATAKDIQQMYPDATIENLTQFEPAPDAGKPGRKKNHGHASESEICTSSTNSSIRRRFLIDDPADLIQIPGFRMSEWQHKKSKRPWCADKLLSTSEFVEYLQQMNHRSHIATKEKALLWSPSAFYDDRTKLNCLLVRGIVLDIEGGIRIEDFAGYFPDLEMIIHPSFNHSAEDHRYRVMIPTTDDMSGKESEMIRRSLMRQLENAGFGRKKDRNYRPTTADLAKPKHGVDISKMNAASLFYLPCNQTRITHLHDNRSPLNPVVWLGTAPRDIVDLVHDMYEPETASQGLETANQVEVEVPLPEDKSENLARILAHFERNGGYTKGGRTPFWNLSKTLRSTGMDIEQIRQTLSEVAGAMHDPRERRSEIGTLIRDIDKKPYH